jgi:nitroreductase
MSIDPRLVPAFPAENAPSAPVRASAETLRLLAERRSSKPFALSAPGPTPAQLDAILKLAARAPDHGKLAPWRFIVFEGEGAVRAGEKVAAALEASGDGASETIAALKVFFSRTPVTVGVISTAAKHAKIPEWEQVLSAGAVVQNLLIAAQAFGFGAVWLTGWAAYDAGARAALGLDAQEQVAGFIHIGTQTESAPERARPDMARIVTRF